MSGLKALVLVGGFGTRLRPLTNAVPKPLIPVAGQPLLYHVFDLVPREVTSITVACGYRADLIESHLKAHPYRLPVDVVREETPLGTGGGMRHAGGSMSDPFFLLNGDVIAGLDSEALLKRHRETGAFGTMALVEVEDPEPYGVAALDPNGRILSFVEKPKREVAPSRWINAGVAVWARAALDAVPAGRPVSFEKEVLPGLVPKGLQGFTFRSWWEDAGTPTRILNAQRLLFDHPRTGKLAPQARLPDAQVVPPVSSGPGCRAAGAQVGRYVTLGARVTLGVGSRVEDSILLDDVTVGEGATISRCLLAPGTKVPAGTNLADTVLGPPTPAGA